MVEYGPSWCRLLSTLKHYRKVMVKKRHRGYAIFVYPSPDKLPLDKAEVTRLAASKEKLNETRQKPNQTIKKNPKNKTKQKNKHRSMKGKKSRELKS